MFRFIFNHTVGTSLTVNFFIDTSNGKSTNKVPIKYFLLPNQNYQYNAEDLILNLQFDWNFLQKVFFLEILMLHFIGVKCFILVAAIQFVFRLTLIKENL